jgi:hypothetical protein
MPGVGRTALAKCTGRVEPQPRSRVGSSRSAAATERVKRREPSDVELAQDLVGHLGDMG